MSSLSVALLRVLSSCPRAGEKVKGIQIPGCASSGEENTSHPQAPFPTLALTHLRAKPFLPLGRPLGTFPGHLSPQIPSLPKTQSCCNQCYSLGGNSTPGNPWGGGASPGGDGPAGSQKAGKSPGVITCGLGVAFSSREEQDRAGKQGAQEMDKDDGGANPAGKASRHPGKERAEGRRSKVLNRIHPAPSAAA